MNKFTRAVCVETDFDIFVKKSVFPWEGVLWKNGLENLRNVEIKRNVQWSSVYPNFVYWIGNLI